ncbi:HET domain-containing protein, partial [Candidatus Bathyarchaeota archaeon]|nr:HET domain-containing protein [Candidatus Bathyarchaeota archaeon]
MPREKRKRLSAGGRELGYPKRLREYLQPKDFSELAIVERALADGLDPNLLWEEEELVIPWRPKGDDVSVPDYDYDSVMWPHYNTPLHRAIYFAEFESAHLLLRHGAEIDLYNSFGRTPLHEAVWNRKHRAIRFLLARNADMNKMTVEAHVRYKGFEVENHVRYRGFKAEYHGRLTDVELDMHGRGGELSLQRALFNSDTATLRLLIEAGVDLCPVSQRPWTALDLALLAEDLWAVDSLLFLDKDAKLPAEPPTSESAEFDLAGDSEKLLAFAKTRDLVPPPELHAAYRHAVRQVMERGIIGPISTTLETYFIREVFKALRDATGSDHQQHHKYNMCSSCRTFQSEVSYTFAVKESTPITFQLYENRDQLNDSAKKGCPLCGIAADALDLTERKAAADHAEFKARLGVEHPAKQNTQIWNSSPPVSLTIELRNPSGIGWLGPGSPVVVCGELSKSLSWISLSDRTIIPTSKGHDNPDDSTGSASAMHVAKKWLETCRNGHSHSACRQPNRNTSNVWPSRLLHVGEPSGNPRLVAAESTREPYCALSYCWGNKGAFVTTRSNLSQNMSGIPLGCLPAVMTDAISVARTLGYRYLWIDALCIVQDDEKDWATEAARMGAIYSNAELTISTLVGSDSQTNLFQSRSLRAVHPVPLDFWEPKHKRGKVAVWAEWAARNPDISGPVHSRAWTLQEQLLSKRILYFGRDMLHWECLAGYRLEANPSGDEDLLGTSRELEDRLATKRAMNKAWDEMLTPSRWTFELWKGQLEEFTRKEITYSCDRLSAFASISQTLASGAGQQSLGGIWNGDRLLDSLCWRVMEPRPGTGTPNMPSWTWASVDGAISFDAVKRSTGSNGVEFIPCVKVESFDVEANESMSRVSGSITIRGKLCRKKPWHSSIAESVPDSEKETLRRGYWPGGCGGTMSPYPSRGVFLDHTSEAIEDVYAVNVFSIPGAPDTDDRLH